MSDLSWLDGAPMDPNATPAERLPTIPGFPFAHAGACVVISGPTGAGRSSLIEACLYDGALQGVRALYLGHEVSEDEFNARSQLLAQYRDDQVDDHLRSRLANVRYLDLGSTMVRAWQEPAQWIAGIVERRLQVVAVDPLSAVASALDLDFDKKNAEFITWYDRIVQPLVAAGVTVAILDNIGYASDAAKRPKGVSAKIDKPDLTLTCARAPAGLIVRTQKVRSIRSATRYGDSWLFRKDDQTLERQNTTTGDFKPTTIMEHVCRLIENQPGITTTAIIKGVPSKDEHVSTAIRELVETDRIRKVPDGRTATYYPLDAADAAPQIPLIFPPPTTPTGTGIPTDSQHSRFIPTDSQRPSDRGFPSSQPLEGVGMGTPTDNLNDAINQIAQLPPEQQDAAWATLAAKQKQAA